MSEALEGVYYIFQKFLDWVFNCYIFEGVSLGMLFICCIIFSILLHYLLAVPKIPVPLRRDYSDRGGK